MKNILLVDDNKYILDALALTIRVCARDCTILMAKNGREAAHILNGKPVDLILTDIEMPVMNASSSSSIKTGFTPPFPSSP